MLKDFLEFVQVLMDVVVDERADEQVGSKDFVGRVDVAIPDPTTFLAHKRSAAPNGVVGGTTIEADFGGIGFQHQVRGELGRVGMTATLQAILQEWPAQMAKATRRACADLVGVAPQVCLQKRGHAGIPYQFHDLRHIFTCRGRLTMTLVKQTVGTIV